jgi:hypothetical protein
MNLIDTNGINRILSTGAEFGGLYYLAPDIVEEAEMTQLIFSKSLPANLVWLSRVNDFDEAVYIRHYRDILNRYGGRSFFNMTGFGDVSILAALLALKDVRENRRQTQLFQDSEELVVYTDDDKLTKKIKKELGGKVVVRPTNSIS